MEINKKSWHYRLVRYMNEYGPDNDRVFNAPKNLCEYLVSLGIGIFAAIISVAFIAAVVSWILKGIGYVALILFLSNKLEFLSFSKASAEILYNSSNWELATSLLFYQFILVGIGSIISFLLVASLAVGTMVTIAYGAWKLLDLMKVPALLEKTLNSIKQVVEKHKVCPDIQYKE